MPMSLGMRLVKQTICHHDYNDSHHSSMNTLTHKPTTIPHTLNYKSRAVSQASQDCTQFYSTRQTLCTKTEATP